VKVCQIFFVCRASLVSLFLLSNFIASHLCKPAYGAESFEKSMSRGVFVRSQEKNGEALEAAPGRTTR